MRSFGSSFIVWSHLGLESSGQVQVHIMEECQTRDFKWSSLFPVLELCIPCHAWHCFSFITHLPNPKCNRLRLIDSDSNPLSNFKPIRACLWKHTHKEASSKVPPHYHRWVTKKLILKIFEQWHPMRNVTQFVGTAFHCHSPQAWKLMLLYQFYRGRSKLRVKLSPLRLQKFKAISVATL